MKYVFFILITFYLVACDLGTSAEDNTMQEVSSSSSYIIPVRSSSSNYVIPVSSSSIFIMPIRSSSSVYTPVNVCTETYEINAACYSNCADEVRHAAAGKGVGRSSGTQTKIENECKPRCTQRVCR